MKYFILLSFFIVLHSTAQAATLYATSQASSSNSCTTISPCAIETAFTQANLNSSADTLILTAGTYYPTASLKITESLIVKTDGGTVVVDGSFVFRNSDPIFEISTPGTAQDQISFQDFSIFGRGTIHGNGITVLPQDKSYIQISNMTFENTVIGIETLSPNSETKITNSRFDSNSSGAVLSGSIDSITNNIFSNHDTVGLAIGNLIAGNKIYIQNNTFENNLYYGMSQSASTARTVVVLNNEFLNNGFYGYLAERQTSQSSSMKISVYLIQNQFIDNGFDGIHLNGDMISGQIYKNEIFCSGNAIYCFDGINLENIQNGLLIKNNFIHDMSTAIDSKESNSKIAYNTFHNNRYGIESGDTANNSLGDDSYIVNNIFHQNNTGFLGSSLSLAELGNNIFYNRSQNLSGNYTSISRNIFGNPFLDPQDNCTPRMGLSLAVDSANTALDSVAVDFYGNTRDRRPDIGACEFSLTGSYDDPFDNDDDINNYN